jgi:hypothetical protein
MEGYENLASLIDDRGSSDLRARCWSKLDLMINRGSMAWRDGKFAATLTMIDPFVSEE